MEASLIAVQMSSFERLPARAANGGRRGTRCRMELVQASCGVAAPNIPPPIVLTELMRRAHAVTKSSERCEGSRLTRARHTSRCVGARSCARSVRHRLQRSRRAEMTNARHRARIDPARCRGSDSRLPSRTKNVENYTACTDRFAARSARVWLVWRQPVQRLELRSRRSRSERDDADGR